MGLYTYYEFEPQIGKDCYIAPSAELVGKVYVAENANVWFHVVARGDENEIHIGENTNIQDLSMLHVTKQNALYIGKNVTVGHHVVLHACTVEDNCLIGMGAIVLDGSVIGKGSVVAAGSVVPPNKTYPPNSMIMGQPAKAVRELKPEEKEMYNNHYRSYLPTKNEYLDPKVVRQIR